ncbi:hypothetical protein ILUMI_09174 [Ignelater luminosus]|uniref:Polycystic kidney disease 2-like 1 protein n=1 Tax=Ignelater luminosus TaxID=2038154 RepID=A0A8K0D4R7_IGNLU|nr:hypothetical protein ILUMI_09174 [Ignelater luminosus]
MSSKEASPRSPSSAYINLRQAMWVTKQMAEDQTREMILQITLRELIFYGIFVILVTIFAVGMVFPSMYYLTRVLQELFLEKQFQTLNNVEITFSDIKSASDFWAYCETILLDGFHWEYWYDSTTKIKETDEDDKKILYENKLLGIPRLRQLKVRNDSCAIHQYFRRMFLACYDRFSRRAEDTEPFGLGKGTAWTFSTEQATGSISYWGKVGSYHGGGYYQDLSLDRKTTRETIATLKQNLWITRGTRAVFLDFTVYNANLNLFCVIKIVFEFPPTGGVLPSYSFQTVKLIRYVTSSDYFILACELLVLGFVIYYTVEEIREIFYFRWTYMTQFWNYIDLILLVLAYCCLALGATRVQVVITTLNKYLYVTDEYANFEFVARLHIIYNCFVAIFLFFTYVKIFKYLSFNKTMGQLNNTLHRCALDIVGFSVMFFIIFFAYAELGYLLFGTEVEGFSSFGVSMFTLLRTILGDFDYMEIERANRILAPVYFLTYIFFVFFVLLNMFLAIINDTYSDVKTEISVTPDEIQMSQYFKRGFYRFLSKCGCGRFISPEKQKESEYSVTIEEIRGALKKCGFTDLEIEMFFSRYNIDPTAEVGEFDISKLVADLEGRPYDAPEDPQAQKAGSRKAASGTPLVTLEDFVAQQERLVEIETTIALLTTKVDALLKKLDTLDNVRKGPKSK